jgi:DNA polymerase phi
VTKDTKKVEINLANFWSVVVDGALLPSSHERKHLAMELLLLILPRLPTSEFVSVIMSNVFIKCIMSILSSTDTLLHKCARRCLSEICNWAQSNDQHRVAVIVSLQKNSHGKFDSLSKTLTVRTLSKGLTNETRVMAFIKSLEELFQTGDPLTSKNSDTVEEDEDEPVIAQDKAGSSDRIWILEQMGALCRHVELEPRVVRVTLYKEVMKFLVLHSVFDASKLSDGKLGGSESLRWPLLPLSDYIRKLCADRLRSILVDAEQWKETQKVKTSKAGPVEGGEKVIDAEDFALFSALYCESIQKSPAAKLAHPLKEEDAATIKTLHETVSSLSAAVSHTPLYAARVFISVAV